MVVVAVTISKGRLRGVEEGCGGSNEQQGWVDGRRIGRW